jgi:hypothetical protein
MADASVRIIACIATSYARTTMTGMSMWRGALGSAGHKEREVGVREESASEEVKGKLGHKVVTARFENCLPFHVYRGGVLEYLVA